MQTTPPVYPEFFAPISRAIWEQKYRLARRDQSSEATLDDTLWRVARAAARAETGGEAIQNQWAQAFHTVMANSGFLPGGRILAGAGTERDVTLFNCFVLGPIADDLGAIFDSIREAGLTLQAGGGIGHDFSTLRPRGARVHGVDATASGPVSFMDVWDAMCATMVSAGQRRGAMMATLRCDHPSILEFIAAKSDARRLRNFNLSVLVTDAFIAAVKADTDWTLVFDGKIYNTLPARELWHAIARANYDYAEPGVIFIDRVNEANNLSYCETIHATNPCGEQPLPPYGACLLGSINLTQMIENPLSPQAAFNAKRLTATVTTAVRFLDNIIDISRYPLAAQAHEAKSKRRIGLGVTGLADALILLGIDYGTQAGRDIATSWMATIKNAAYRASAALAAEKGVFPAYQKDKFLSAPNVRALSQDTQDAIAKHGLRNGCLTTIAPTGTISLLAGNVSSGIEPVFDFRYQRKVRSETGADRQEIVDDYAYALFQRQNNGQTPVGKQWVTAGQLSAQDHLAMQAALQPHVDSAISKTINCPADIAPEAFETLYMAAYDLGLKGCTLFRPNAVTGTVLSQLAPTPSPVAEPVAKPLSSQSTTRATGAIELGHSVVRLSEPLARDDVLDGRTYKLRWPGSDHAFYVTINDIVRDGRRRPFEIFINTKDLTHFAWTIALTRMISAVFRRGGDIAFVAEELKAIFDPQGGQWIDGRYVPSFIAAMGEIIETHVAGLAGSATTIAAAAQTSIGGTGHQSKRPSAAAVGASPLASRAMPQLCPRCSQPNLRREGRCEICPDCGFANCG